MILGSKGLNAEDFHALREKALSLKGGILLLSGPSGVGKTSFVEVALKKYSHQLEKTITYTTRLPRKTGEFGNPYHFVSYSDFQSLKKKGAFLEWAEIYNEFYATAFSEVCRVWQSEKSIIKDVDTQGGKNIKKLFPQAVTVFIYPPSLYDLKQRLLKRGMRDDESLKRRLLSAEKEMAEGAEYEHKLVNEDFKKTWLKLKKIIEKTLRLS